MSACYHSGLQAEALQVYRDARETLVSELGVEPGPELREMQRRILTVDPDVTAMPSARVTMRAGRTPRLLTSQPLSEDERAQLARLRTENARLASELEALKRTSAVQLP